MAKKAAKKVTLKKSKGAAAVEESPAKALAGHSVSSKTLEDNYGIVLGDAQDAIDWVNDERVALPDPSTMITPFGWKVLVMPMRPQTVSKGGILIPQVRQDTDQYLNYVGRVVSLGPLAYKHSKFASMGLKVEDTPQIGDWVLYPIYQYQRIDYKGRKLILINDDQFLAIVPKGVSPWDFKLER